MATKRRRGKSSAESREKLIQAARRVMVEEGYAAVTTRKVASEAGFKPQLIYYYFATMDELLLSVLRRACDAILAEHTRCLTARRPLRALWEYSFKGESAVLTVEFMALANHRPEIARELARFGNQLRTIQQEFFAQVLESHGVDRAQVPPIAVSLLLLSLSHTMGAEAVWGLETGHEETLALVDRLVAQFELPLDRG